MWFKVVSNVSSRSQGSLVTAVLRLAHVYGENGEPGFGCRCALATGAWSKFRSVQGRHTRVVALQACDLVLQGHPIQPSPST